MDVGGNVQGDELIAMCWQKYLLREEGIDEVVLLSPETPFRDDLDVVIHFNPHLKPCGGGKNVLYLQNVFPKPHWKDGTVGIFSECKSKFDGFIFTSRRLMKACDSEGVVVPFATDPERFFPQYVSEGPYYQLPVSFVGNDLRGREVNERYFHPAIQFGLKIWGKTKWYSPLDEVWQGGLPLEDLPVVYTNSVINLNVHIPEHNDFGTINLRIFNILACSGFLISDSSWAVREVFGNSVVCTEGGDDLIDKLSYFLKNEQERKKRSIEGRKIVLSNHTYESRVKTVLSYLKEIM